MPLDKSLSVVLIGMPGAGKSTVGVILAKRLAKDFVDTDLLIQVKAQQPLQQVIDEQGYQKLRELEQEVLLEGGFSNHVVATGGSAVYGDLAMQRLKQLGPIVYLRVSQEELLQRIGDYSLRGIASDPNFGFADVFNERTPLYERYADITVDGVGKSVEEIVEEIAGLVVDG